MSEQRKVRQELRQGLHQFLMQMYMSYVETNSEEEAKKIVIEEIKEQYDYFASDSLVQGDTKSILEEKINELTEVMNQQKDYDSQLYYAEKVDALQGALEILKNS